MIPAFFQWQCIMAVSSFWFKQFIIVLRPEIG
jgi:hypothetical protein